MKHYIYKLEVYDKNIFVRKFLGNDKNEMWERFQMWLIKSNHATEDVTTYYDYVQHANIRAN